MKAIVIGAGIAGLAIAKNLAEAGWEVAVFERSDGPRTNGYMMDFFGPGYDAAENMGLLPALQDCAYTVREAAYLDSRGRITGRLSFGRFAKSVDGRLLSIMRPDLEKVLRESLPVAVLLRYGAALERIENGSDGVRVHLSDGTVAKADLLVGADGIHSAVRAAVFGPEREFIRYLGYHTAAFVFDDPVISQQVRGSFVLSDTKDRQLGLYGLRDAKVAAFMIHRDESSTLPPDRQAALQAEFAEVGWAAPRTLAQTPPDPYYDVVAQVHMEHWHSGRVVLVGDACQAVSLLAGQGASLAVAGARVLAAHLAKAPSIDDGVAAYENQWLPVIREKQEVGRRAARWFLPSSNAQLALRRLMLGLSSFPAVTRIMGNSLAGKAVPVP